MTRYEVLLTAGAEGDLEELYEYLRKAASQLEADHLLKRLIKTSASLTSFPERGSCPKELEKLGIREYRQVFFKPYRLIYRVHKKQVIVYLIADGRRDFQALLEKRLLRGNR